MAVCTPPARTRRAFTLIEMMIVVAVMTVLLAVTMPAIKGIMQTSQLVQADNMLRATLMSGRSYAIQHQVIAGVRFQEDGHMVVVYARNMNDTYNRENYMVPPVYDMKSVDGMEPQKLPDPWRVTFRDVGDCYNPTNGSGGMLVSWIGPTEYGYLAAPQWLDQDNAWFVFPLVLFSPAGRVIFSQCRFSGDPSRPWYPTLEGAFGQVVDTVANNNPIPGQPYLKYTNQGVLVGWRCNSYKGGGSHNIPVEAPSLSSALRLFNYKEFRAVQATGNNKAALLGIAATGSDCLLDVSTGMIVRERANMQTGSN
jgi:prepilin-type N-terminal cleavage/methylation domain-containing protein